MSREKKKFQKMCKGKTTEGLVNAADGHWVKPGGPTNTSDAHHLAGASRHYTPKVRVEGKKRQRQPWSKVEKTVGTGNWNVYPRKAA